MAGIYIHIPFCRQACVYCNFHFSVSSAAHADFTTALHREVLLRREYLAGRPVSTIYFGGGTPSLLPPDALARILDTVRNHFPVAADAEITLEANPDDITPDNLRRWQTAGFNRMSLGVQSFFDADLTWMHRAHDAGQAGRSVKLAQDAGFTNLSLDLIYGLPGLSDDLWQRNIGRVIELAVPHVSCYALTVEPKTTLQKQIAAGTKPDVAPEDQSRQFLAGIDWLEAAGFEHYEISNFARPGHRSRHNSAYWQSAPYAGLGPSAHSFDGVSRQWNVSNNRLYIEALQEGRLPFEREVLTLGEKLNEFIMISLRTREGLPLLRVAREHGGEKRTELEKKARRYLDSGHLQAVEDSLRLTREGKCFADGIAAALFF